MKSRIFAFILIVTGVILYRTNSFFTQNINRILYHSACDSPITYSLGTIDDKFGLTPKDVLRDTSLASSLWGKYSGKPLFLYDPNSSFKINLIYDERQQLKTQIGSLQNEIAQQKKSLEPKADAFESKKADFQKRWNEFVEEVNTWNNQGGAPEDVYNRLIQEKNNLMKESENINAQARILNQQTQNFNTDVHKLNETVNQFQDVVSEHPEEGVYNPKNNRIDIYYNNNANELVHTIAHEFGHALGLDHVNNPNAIMYKFSNESITLTSEDSGELTTICRPYSVFTLAYDTAKKVTQYSIAQLIRMYNTQTSK
jgi:hypothetical protein